MPMQYNTNHFTFVSDENGVGNRWAGFFTTKRDGLDTLYFVGDEMLRNPSIKEMDSALVAWQKQEPDSIAYFQVFKDSTYTFPITNYQSSLTESRVAGNNGQISETRREGNDKYLYKLKINEEALLKRNVTAPPAVYMKKLMNDKKIQQGKANTYTKQITQVYAKKFKGVPSDMAYKGFESVYIFARLITRYPDDFMSHLNEYAYKVFNDYNFKAVNVNKHSKIPDYFENKRLYFMKVLNGKITKAW